MVTTASKFFFAGAVVALLAAGVYGLGTDGDLVGVATLGFRGPVGEQAGYTILTTVAALLLALGVASSILRDADPEAQAAAARLEALPPAVPAARVSYWPVLGALGAVVAAVGLVASPVLFVIGLIGVGLVMLEWMVTAWSERATGDPAINREIRNRLMYPIEIPVGGALGILVIVVSISRVLLALPKAGSNAVAIVVSALVLAVGFLLAYRPKLGKNFIAGVLAVFGLAVVTSGVIAAASGTREFEHHEAEHTDEGGEGGEHDEGGGPDAGDEPAPPAEETEGEDTPPGAEDPEEQPPGTAEGTEESEG